MYVELNQLSSLTADEALRLKCVELAIKSTGNAHEVDLAKEIYEFVRSKADPSLAKEDVLWKNRNMPNSVIPSINL